MGPTATNEALQRQQQREVDWSATLPSSDDAGDREDVPCYFAGCPEAMIMKSRMMLSLSSMADEVVQAEVQQLDVEMEANEDLHKLLYDMNAPASLSGYLIDRQLKGRRSDENVIIDSRHVELRETTKLECYSLTRLVEGILPECVL